MLIKLDTDRPFKRNKGEGRMVFFPMHNVSESMNQFKTTGNFLDDNTLCRVWTAPDHRPLKDRTFFVQSLSDGWQTIYKGKAI